MASFEGGVYDLRTYDLKTACPDPAACAYGVVVDNELHRLDDAGNEAAAAAVAGAGRCTNFSTPARRRRDMSFRAGAGPEASWFVKISGEPGAAGHVSIDRIDRGDDSRHGCLGGRCPTRRPTPKPTHARLHPEYYNLADWKTLIAGCADFAAFKTAVAAL